MPDATPEDDGPKLSRETAILWGRVVFCIFAVVLIFTLFAAGTGRLPYYTIRTNTKIGDLEFSRDGKTIAYSSNAERYYQANPDQTGNLYIYSVSSHALVLHSGPLGGANLIGTTGPASFVQVTSDPDSPAHLSTVSSSGSQTIAVADNRFDGKQVISSPLLMPNPRQIVCHVSLPGKETTLPSDALSVSDTTSKSSYLIRYDQELTSIVSTRDGVLLAVNLRSQPFDQLGPTEITEDMTGDPSRITVYRLSDGKVLQTFSAGDIGCMAFSADGEHLFYLENRLNTAICWSVKTGKRVWIRIGDPGKYFDGLSTSPSGKVVALAGLQGVEFLNASTGRSIQSGISLPMNYANWIPCRNNCEFSPDGKTLISRGDCMIYFWHVPNVN